MLDFGLAKAQSTDSSSSVSSVFGYTPQYAPLEQIQDLGTSPQSDIYALGATLYHLLTGVKPPDALARAAALVNSKPNPLKPANEVDSAVGPELAAILNRAMAQKPDERYASAMDFREALRRAGRIDDGVTAASHKDYLSANDMSSETGDTTIVRTDRIVSSGGLGSRTIAAMFIILAVAFGVFCRYYPWKAPPAPGIVVSNNAPAVGANELRRAEVVRGQKTNRKSSIFKP